MTFRASDRGRLDLAAHELLKAAGRPDTPWNALTEYEQEAWRVCVRRVLNVYHETEAA